MHDQPPNPKELGFYVELAQVGLEMVAPVGIGLVLDFYLHWGPWGAVVGAILGLVAGLAHLVAIQNRHEQGRTSESRQDEP
jgi:F0F1-type ATP synthase assembly protein I